eukprot:m51a1_g3388 putative sphingosine kinase 2-like (552) ;mRNA; r:509061-511023
MSATAPAASASPRPLVSAAFVVDGARATVSVGAGELSWAAASASRPSRVALADIAAICVDAPGRALVAHCLVVSPRDPSAPRAYERHELAWAGPAAPQPLDSEDPFAGTARPLLQLPVLVIVNPFSGTKRAPAIWSNECQPLFDAAGVRYEVLQTTRAGEAYDYTHTMPLGRFSSVATVGGDGIMCEAINGIMSRDDFRAAIETTPVTPIPGGTGNGAAESFFLSGSPVVATCHIIKNARRAVDLYLTTQPKLRQYIWGFLSCEYGIVADVDFGSEKVRFLGPARNSVWAVWRIMCSSAYRCRITYLPCERDKSVWSGVKCSRLCDVCRYGPSASAPTRSDIIDQSHDALALREAERTEGKAAADSHADDDGASSVCSARSDRDEETPSMPPPANPGAVFTAALTFDSDWVDGMPAKFAQLFDGPRHRVGHAPPAGWETREVSLSFATFQNLPWMMSGMLAAPYAHLADGCMDICFAASQGITRFQFLKFFSNLGDASHVGNPKFDYIKVRAFTLEPLDPTGFVGIDGERIPFSTMQFSVAPGLLNVLCYS